MVWSSQHVAARACEAGFASTVRRSFRAKPDAPAVCAVWSHAPHGRSGLCARRGVRAAGKRRRLWRGRRAWRCSPHSHDDVPVVATQTQPPHESLALSNGRMILTVRIVARDETSKHFVPGSCWRQPRRQVHSACGHAGDCVDVRVVTVVALASPTLTSPSGTSDRPLKTGKEGGSTRVTWRIRDEPRSDAKRHCPRGHVPSTRAHARRAQRAGVRPRLCGRRDLCCGPARRRNVQSPLCRWRERPDPQ